MKIPDHFSREWIQALGEDTVSGAFQSDWNAREVSLKACLVKLQQAAVGMDSLAGEACLGLVKETISDKVTPVYFASLSLLTGAMRALSLSSAHNESSLQSLFAPLLAPLLVRIGNNHARIREQTVKTVHQIAVGCNKIGPTHIISALCADPNGKAGRRKPTTTALLGRLEAIQRLVSSIDDRKNLDPCVELALAGLVCNEEKVRQMAAKVLIKVYKTVRRQRQDFWKTAEELFAGINPALERAIRKKFTEVDVELRMAPQFSVEDWNNGGDVYEAPGQTLSQQQQQVQGALGPFPRPSNLGPLRSMTLSGRPPIPRPPPGQTAGRPPSQPPTGRTEGELSNALRRRRHVMAMGGDSTIRQQQQQQQQQQQEEGQPEADGVNQVILIDAPVSPIRKRVNRSGAGGFNEEEGGQQQYGYGLDESMSGSGGMDPLLAKALRLEDEEPTVFPQSQHLDDEDEALINEILHMSAKGGSDMGAGSRVANFAGSPW